MRSSARGSPSSVSSTGDLTGMSTSRGGSATTSSGRWRRLRAHRGAILAALAGAREEGVISPGHHVCRRGTCFTAGSSSRSSRSSRRHRIRGLLATCSTGHARSRPPRAPSRGARPRRAGSRQRSTSRRQGFGARVAGLVMSSSASSSAGYSSRSASSSGRCGARRRADPRPIAEKAKAGLCVSATSRG